MDDCKRCRDCGESKPRGEFHRERRSLDGLRVNCKQCRNAYMASRYSQNRETILERQKANPRNPAALDAYQRSYRQKNAERIREKNRKWSAANADRRREYNAGYFRENQEAIRQAASAWRKSNHDKIMAANRERAALMRGAVVDRGITVSALRKRDGDNCTYCFTPLLFGRTSSYEPTKASVDHVVALARGGAHTWENVVLACLRCNIRKGDRSVDDWHAVREHRSPDLHTSTA